MTAALRRVLAADGVNVTATAVKEYMEAADANDDGKISFREFVRAVQLLK